MMTAVSIRDNMLSSMALLLKEWRDRRGWSLRQLGERAGVSYVSVFRIEAGTLDPRLSTLERLARALGISVRDLFSAGRRRTGRRA
jgi:transcriptional regulator with XRE-family HTH domain